ncbi:MAG: class II aldolase/adducin family protein [Lachnospiraceae bacterium]|nr:class II aldolase/adducin family protein [Lachnospiraceae bacterium]
MEDHEEIITEILETAESLEAAGLCLGLYGSISRRIDSEFFCMAGGELNNRPFSADDVRTIRMKKLQGDAALHAAVYRARAEINAVIMTRQCYASAMGIVLPEGISAEDANGNILKIYTVPFTIPGSDAQRSHVRRLAAKERAANALVAIGGAVFSYGETLGEAAYAAQALEDYAGLYLSEIGKMRVPGMISEEFSSQRIDGGIRYAQPDTPQRVRAIHERIYARRPDVLEIFHNRSEAAMTVSRICESLPAYYDDFVRIVGTSVTIPGNSKGDTSRGEVLVSRDINASFVYDDGAYCYGTAGVPAELTAISVEKDCIAQIAAIRLNGAYRISRRDLRRLKRTEQRSERSQHG